jgi:hypothetical protein
VSDALKVKEGWIGKDLEGSGSAKLDIQAQYYAGGTEDNLSQGTASNLGQPLPCDKQRSDKERVQRSKIRIKWVDTVPQIRTVHLGAAAERVPSRFHVPSVRDRNLQQFTYSAHRSELGALNSVHHPVFLRNKSVLTI